MIRALVRVGCWVRVQGKGFDLSIEHVKVGHVIIECIIINNHPIDC